MKTQNIAEVSRNSPTPGPSSWDGPISGTLPRTVAGTWDWGPVRFDKSMFGKRTFDKLPADFNLQVQSCIYIYIAYMQYTLYMPSP